MTNDSFTDLLKCAERKELTSAWKFNFQCVDTGQNCMKRLPGNIANFTEHVLDSV